jgi:trimeric autotransporter adhesin
MMLRAALAFVLLLGACEDGGEPPLVSLTVTPQGASDTAPLSLAKGLTRQLSVSGTYEDGRSVDLTSTATWESSDPGVATITPNGLVAGAAEGTALITSTIDRMVGSLEVQVGPPKVSAIDVRPNPVRIGLSYMSKSGTTVWTTLQLTAKATLTDKTQVDVSDKVAWTAAPGGFGLPVVTVSPSGLVTTELSVSPPSETVVSAASGGVSGQTRLHIYDQVIALEVESVLGGATLPVGESMELAAFATWASLPSLRTAVERNAVWASSNPSVVELGGTPYLVTCAAAGTSSVSATYQGSLGELTVTCLP